MADVSKKELGEAVQLIAEQLHAIDLTIAKIATGLLSLKAIVAIQMNPTDPKIALAQIRDLENSLAKLDPNAAGRQQFSDVIEAVKLWEKHGGAKEA